MASKAFVFPEAHLAFDRKLLIELPERISIGDVSARAIVLLAPAVIDRRIRHLDPEPVLAPEGVEDESLAVSAPRVEILGPCGILAPPNGELGISLLVAVVQENAVGESDEMKALAAFSARCEKMDLS